MNSGFNQYPNSDVSWCTYPEDWPIVDRLGIGAESGIALFDIGHVGIDAQSYLSYLKTTSGWKNAGLIFLVDRENVASLRQELINDDRVYLWDSAVHDHERFHTYIPWFDWVVKADKQLGLSDRLTDPMIDTPHYLFDCIMGMKKPHREYLYKQINSCADIKRCTFMNYLGGGDNYVSGTCYDTLDNFGSKNLSPYVRIDRDDIDADIAELIPYKIYNQAWFSLVNESRPNNDALITEKLAKPLLSRRIFVLFGAQHHLRNLRRLGFETFGDVIDESYDEIEDCETRWKAAWQAALNLVRQDAGSIYQRLRSIIIHNQQLARRVNWWETMATQMYQIVYKYQKGTQP